MKNIIKYLLILFCLNNFVYADDNNIKSIEVNGLERIELANLLSHEVIT